MIKVNKSGGSHVLPMCCFGICIMQTYCSMFFCNTNQFVWFVVQQVLLSHEHSCIYNQKSMVVEENCHAVYSIFCFWDPSDVIELSLSPKNGGLFFKRATVET